MRKYGSPHACLDSARRGAVCSGGGKRSRRARSCHGHDEEQRPVRWPAPAFPLLVSVCQTSVCPGENEPGGKSGPGLLRVGRDKVALYVGLVTMCLGSIGEVLFSGVALPIAENHKSLIFRYNRGLAEREGFEPSVPVRVQRFSRPSRSTTPAPLLAAGLIGTEHTYGNQLYRCRSGGDAESANASTTRARWRGAVSPRSHPQEMRIQSPPRREPPAAAPRPED